jgi:hypothetical protein
VLDYTAGFVLEVSWDQFLLGPDPHRAFCHALNVDRPQNHTGKSARRRLADRDVSRV